LFSNIFENMEPLRKPSGGNLITQMIAEGIINRALIVANETGNTARAIKGNTEEIRENEKDLMAKSEKVE
jgi:hypothetical protein